MNKFFQELKNIRNPEIEKKLQSRNPYVICDLLEETKGGINGIYLRELENAILETRDIVQIYEFMFMAVDMQIPGFNRERFEREIIESKNAKLMCYCMEFVPGTNIEAMLKALKETGNVKYMEMLMCDEEYSDVFEKVKQLDSDYETAVEEAKKKEYFPKSLEEFIEYRESIPRLKEAVKASKNAHYITELANYIMYLNEYKGQAYDIKDLVAVQEEVQDPMQAYEFLASVEVEDKKGLIEAVISSKRPKFMYYVHEYVPNLTESEKKQLKESIIKIDTKGKYRKMLDDEEKVSIEKVEYGGK